MISLIGYLVGAEIEMAHYGVGERATGAPAGNSKVDAGGRRDFCNENLGDDEETALSDAAKKPVTQSANRCAKSLKP